MYAGCRRRVGVCPNYRRTGPDNVTASIGLANSYYAAGDLNATEAVLRRALARHPDSDAAMNNLAQALSDEGRDDEALALIERAVALAGPYAQTVRDHHGAPREQALSSAALAAQFFTARRRSPPASAG